MQRQQDTHEAYSTSAAAGAPVLQLPQDQSQQPTTHHTTTTSSPGSRGASAGRHEMDDLALLDDDLRPRKADRASTTGAAPSSSTPPPGSHPDRALPPVPVTPTTTGKGGDASASVFKQLAASTVRCVLLKVRKPISCGVELLLPIVFIALLAWLSTLVENEDFPGKLFVEPSDTDLPHMSDLVRNATCLNIPSSQGVPAGDSTSAVLDQFVPRCDSAEATAVDTPRDCGGDYLSIVSSNLCLLPRGANALRFFYGDLERPAVMPSMDQSVIAHAALKQLLGELSYRFPQPNVRNSERALGKIYVTPDNAVSRAFVAAMNASAATNGFRLFTDGPMFAGYMPSKDYAFGYFSAEVGAGKCLALINVAAFDPATGEAAIAISMNKTAIPWTNRLRSRFVGGAGNDFKLYYASSFLSLQSSILSSLNEAQRQSLNAGSSTNIPLDAFSQDGNQAAIVPMPFIDWTQQVFLTLAGFMVPLALALSFLALVSSVAERLVQEKELRLREAMAAMGVGKTTLFFGWLLTYGITNLVTAIVCTIMLSTTFMPKSDPSLIFIVFFGFGLSTTTLGTLFSSFFSKSRTASIATPILFFAAAIPSFALGPDPNPNLQRNLQILSPTAFSTALVTMLDYEKNNGIGWGDFNNVNDEIPLSRSVFLMYFDWLLYMFLTWYLDNVLGGDWGVRQHPCFCFLNCCRKHSNAGDGDEEMRLGEGPRTLSSASEAYPVGANEAVSIANVTKEFGSGAEKKVAVNNVSLKIFPAMVTAVLGHNGAGKTTLFNMLTGMLPITRGDCFIYNESITTEPAEARRNIGMCPQHNILWDDLTCYEHLVYFAMVKGVPRAECGPAAEKMLKDVDLDEKRNARTASLSGGQKRKLSVAIAFIGGSKLVLLDEPTAGMDVHTRRHTWDLIQRMAREEQRAIILTTHFMDEAELLGDRVAMMAAGQLHSYGSTTFLKATLGQSYTLNVQYEHPPSDETRAQLMSLVKNDGGISQAKQKEARGREQAVTLPMDDVQKFAPMLQLLESRTREMNITSFSMSAATIEDVFVAIADEDHGPAAPQNADPARAGAYSIDLSGAAAPTSQVHVEAVSPQAAVAAKLLSGAEARGTPSSMRQFLGLVLKRANCIRRDRRTLVLQTLLPVLCILLAMALAESGPPETPSANIAPFDLPDQQNAVVGGCAAGYETAMGDYVDTVPVTPASNGSYTTAVWMRDTFNMHGGKDRTAAIHCLDSNQRTSPTSTTPTTFLFSNSTAFRHSAPWSVMLWYGARSAEMQRTSGRAAANIGKVRMSTMPLPFTAREKTTIDSISNVLMALLIVVPFSFVPSTFTGFVVKERASKAKLLQFVSGVGYGVYWASNFLFDFVAYLVTVLLAIIIFAIFGREEYIGDANAGGATMVLFLMYGFAAIPTSYVMSLAFTNHSTAQNAVLGVFFLAGFGLTLAGYLIELLEGPVALLYIFRLFPPQCLGEGLMALANAPGQSNIGVEVDLYAMDELGYPLLYLGLVSLVMTVTILFVDHPERTKRQQMLSYKSNQKAPAITDEPNDVAVERAQVEQGTATGDDAFLRVLGLRKEYPAPAGSDKPVNVAVQNLTFHVPKGEIFGLLGTNGAGKTTTMNVITGETLPTMGEATVSGHNVVSQAGEARQVIGYCPQFDALHDLMTVDEHLALYCGLRGVSEVEHVASALCTALGLNEYRKVLSKRLSGGNKRKLSVAISLVGAPRLLLLDEPTAGMDPVARRSMCDVVSAVSKHCAVVLTTHHLEEVEALADRAAIMVAGKMQCLGTLEHLKATLGEGYQVSIRIANESTAPAVAQRLNAAYPGQCKLVEQHQTRLRFNVKQGASTTLSGLFALLHEMKTSREAEALGVLDYTVSQSSVEEVFLAVAGGHEPHNDPDSPLSPASVVAFGQTGDGGVAMEPGSAFAAKQSSASAAAPPPASRRTNPMNSHMSELL